MPRVASLYLPFLSIDRLLRSARREGRPDRISSPGVPGEGDRSKNGGGAAPSKIAPPPLRGPPPHTGEDRMDCSVPRGGGWRPGARWAREEQPGRRPVEPEIRQSP